VLDTNLRQPMSQGVLINLFKMSAAKEFMNFEAGLSNYVTELIDIDEILSVWPIHPEHLLKRCALIIAFLHFFVLFVPFCG
jgi:hypothetical protein